MYDFFGREVTSSSPRERLGAWVINLIWAQKWRVTGRSRDAAIFIGEMGDLPDRRFGTFLPNRRQHSQRHLAFVGYALHFDVDDPQNNDQ